MELAAAHVDQVLQSEDGDWEIIDKDVGGVIEELQRLDPRFRVRLNKRQGFYVLFVHDVQGDETRDEFVRSFPAYRNSFGVWEGLDHRIVDRMRLIDGHGNSGYDYVKALEAQDKAVKEAHRKAREEQYGMAGELAAFAVRKDLGEVKNGRIFKPRDL